jgi:hypothetical protein
MPSPVDPVPTTVDSTGISRDSVVTSPPEPGDPPVWEPVPVDFDQSVVLAIGLESASGWGRSIQVVDVATANDLTTVRFEVLTPGEDCTRLMMAPFDPDAIRTSPVVAVSVPRPIGNNVVFERRDVVWHCVLEPDPNTPLTLYYTDGECDLGEAEAIIREGARWDEWLATATKCDLARWGSGTEPGVPEEVKPDGTLSAADTVFPMPIGWFSPNVDFATHAVVILRAPFQRQWGGGIWLDAIDPKNTGTTVDYSTMTPGPACPLVDGGASLRPTVAVRVPLPLPAPVTFRRRDETIDCRWPLPLGEPNPGSGGGSAAGSRGG